MTGTETPIAGRRLDEIFFDRRDTSRAQLCAMLVAHLNSIRAYRTFSSPFIVEHQRSFNQRLIAGDRDASQYAGMIAAREKRLEQYERQEPYYRDLLANLDAEQAGDSPA